VEVHTSALRPEDVTTVDGWPVTSLARTGVDLGRTLPLEQAVAALDVALADGLDAEALDDALQHAYGWPGIGAARRAATLSDARAESVGESVSRVRLHELGLPAPVPQLAVHGPHGFVGRADFGWPELRTLGEFDGRVKYGRLLKPGQDPGDVVWSEKLREDALRDLGWQIVRWTWDELADFTAVARRLLRAFARA
jgi:hypothetical protein